jgi:hypothetical protein
LRRSAEEKVAVSFALAAEEEPTVVEEEEVAVSRLAQAGVVEVDSERLTQLFEQADVDSECLVQLFEQAGVVEVSEVSTTPLPLLISTNARIRVDDSVGEKSAALGQNPQN